MMSKTRWRTRNSRRRLKLRNACFGSNLLKNSSSNSSKRFLRNNDSIRADKLNHRCAYYRWDDRILRVRSPCGVFQQNPVETGLQRSRPDCQECAISGFLAAHSPRCCDRGEMNYLSGSPLIQRGGSRVLPQLNGPMAGIQESIRSPRNGIAIRH